jgi:hypothetical protein
MTNLVYSLINLGNSNCKQRLLMCRYEIDIKIALKDYRQIFQIICTCKTNTPNPIP